MNSNKHIHLRLSFSKFHWILIILNVLGCLAYLAILFILAMQGKISNEKWYITCTPIISVVACITNLFCIILLSQKKVLNFYFGIAAVILLSCVSLLTKNYGFAILNVYYIAMNIAGIFIWKKQSDDGQILKPRKMKWGTFFLILGLALIPIAALSYVFSIPAIENFFSGSAETNKNFLYWLLRVFDAGSLVLCIIAMIYVSMGYKQQWEMWLVANAFNIALWLINTIKNFSSSNLFLGMVCAFTLFTYLFSFTNSVYSYIKWKREDDK